jgi:hypothetical protein
MDSQDGQVLYLSTEYYRCAECNGIYSFNERPAYILANGFLRCQLCDDFDRLCAALEANDALYSTVHS